MSGIGSVCSADIPIFFGRAGRREDGLEGGGRDEGSEQG